MKQKSIVFDLDDTICYTNHQYKDAQLKYGEALPNEEMIAGMRKLKAEGFHITILTARRMLTHNGNIEAIIKDVGKITEDWLEQHGVPYDELVWGKPYCTHYYVDDKAMNLEDFDKWINSI
tara:strand:- start:3042 stop:3404 length:363 start_codon:yes stop_codon:yes gene_type:complete